jgi:hypothetical protein
MCVMRGGGECLWCRDEKRALGPGEAWGEAGFPFLHEYFISYIFMLSSFIPIILFFRRFQFLGPDFYIFLYSLVYLLSTSHITPYYLHF